MLPSSIMSCPCKDFFATDVCCIFWCFQSSKMTKIIWNIGKYKYSNYNSDDISVKVGRSLQTDEKESFGVTSKTADELRLHLMD